MRVDINLVKFGIKHFDKEIEDIKGLGLNHFSVGSKKNLKELLKILDWCDEKNIRYMFGWRLVKMDNDVGSYFYRLCPSLGMVSKEDAMLIRLAWPDLGIKIDEPEEK